MKISFCHTLRKYNKSNLFKDILTGIIIAAVSIPISMGYSQIAGLPAVYGLYGSVFPILIFALFSTSPQLMFGVDAAPAALVGAALVSLGISPGSEEALRMVPAITFFVALWLMLFYIFKAGKLVNYISKPVMGGFISGICSTIILMQIPKLYGASAGTGELFELLKHIYETIESINVPSLLLGIVTLIILIVAKKLVPKFPMAVVMMVAGAVVSYIYPLDKLGVTLLSSVEKGLPKFLIPDIAVSQITDVLGISLSVAVVIMAETLLAENNFAQRKGYKLDDNQEILAFSLGNFAAAFTGCCPINGSVSRTTMGEQYGGKTQLTSIVAGLTMMALLICGTGFIGYLPVPVLTAIVISALMGAVEFHLAAKLWKVSRTEFYIFCGAFLGVLVLGTVNGVLIGIILSFAAVIIRGADPPRSFLGMIPGHDEFLNVSRFKHTYPIEHVIIYRFSSNLFFANVGIFQSDLEAAIKPDTKAVIIDASGMGSIDVTAAERLEIIYKNLKSQGIKFYLTEHISAVNKQLRKLGLSYMIEEGAVRRSIDTALNDMGMTKPYSLEGVKHKTHSIARKRAEDSVQEFLWAFGDEAEEVIERQINIQIEKLKETGDLEILTHGSWNKMGTMDEDEWLEHLEAHLAEIVNASGEDEKDIAEKLEKRRMELTEKIAEKHPELAERFEKRRHYLDEQLRHTHPDIYEKIIKLRER
jgi:high affinity sulfate transporter 1